MKLFFIVSIVQSLVLTSHGLSTLLKRPEQKQRQLSTPIEKVAIIGSGIAGLSLAHALSSSSSLSTTSATSTNTMSPEIKTSIFDSRSSLNFESGAGVQINGGARTLQKINPNLHRAVVDAALPLTNIRSRIKPWFGDDNFATLLELNLEQIIKKTGGDVEKELIVDGEVMAYTIMRGALQEVLLNELPSDTSSNISFGKTLIGIETNKENNGIMCKFHDGTIDGPFDLVIGCDGINSAVKEYIDKGSIAPIDTNGQTNNKRSQAIYSGIRIQYAVQDGDTCTNEEKKKSESAELIQYFGKGAYALTGKYGAGKGRLPTKSAFLISQDSGYIGPFKKANKDNSGMKKESTNNKANENADWTQDVQTLGSDMTNRIKESNVPNFDLDPIIDQSDRFFELGVYFHNPFTLKGWSRGVQGSGGRFVVVAGDAAHAMPPFLGQGSNQAIQDAYSLASKIFEHNTNCVSKHEIEEIEAKSIQELLKDYEHIRWAPTASITLKAAFLGYLETGGNAFLSKFRDAFFFFAGKVGLARKIFLDAATPKL